MRLLTSFLKDLKVSFKTFYIYIEIIMALIIVLVLLFVIPENFTSSAKAFIYLDPALLETELGEELTSNTLDEIVLVDNKEDIPRLMEEDRNSVGGAILLEKGKMVYDLTLQGYESERFRNVIEKALTVDMVRQLPDYESKVSIETLGESSERLSDRINMLPVFLVINSAFMGLFIIAAYIFMDKDEGTIKAFAVTPSRVWEYLLSKLGIILVTGLMTGLLTAVLVAGFNVHYVHLIILLIASNVFGSSVGLFIASFYDNIIKAMGALYITIITFAFATISYYMPSFTPLVIRILPSYPMLFAFREVFLEKPDLGYVYTYTALFFGLAVVFFILANERFKKTLTA